MVLRALLSLPLKLLLMPIKSVLLPIQMVAGVVLLAGAALFLFPDLVLNLVAATVDATLGAAETFVKYVIDKTIGL